MTNRVNIIDDIIRLAIAKKIQIYISTPILNELKIALQYPKIKSKLLPNKTAKFMAWYKYNTQLITVTASLNICRDPKDNKFLELAKTVMADYIITGDQDLLVLSSFGDTQIVKQVEFAMIELV